MGTHKFPYCRNMALDRASAHWNAPFNFHQTSFPVSPAHLSVSCSWWDLVKGSWDLISEVGVHHMGPSCFIMLKVAHLQIKVIEIQTCHSNQMKIYLLVVHFEPKPVTVWTKYILSTTFHVQTLLLHNKIPKYRLIQPHLFHHSKWDNNNTTFVKTPR